MSFPPLQLLRLLALSGGLEASEYLEEGQQLADEMSGKDDGDRRIEKDDATGEYVLVDKEGNEIARSRNKDELEDSYPGAYPDY